ncbi:NADPH quinone oxidoreductase [Arachidicoccus ginsenosidimutans]|uniref:NAD(P)H-dependent oxidoreductase n=1 Tax=Arachidicoccus sp. BS20 TaxID=1850526 RepID=UPI0007F076DE|nr:NAD(P)H-dependent oxidoreductase [Arachidicoccus sp. BS20]ANI89501.1 NADPH quinone oxidoreductase [Arachidicoccus sp. BS20]
MNILIVLAHPEEKSFNGAMFRKGIETLSNAGHEVKISDLYRMNFNPVSDRGNFTSMKNEAVFNQQAEELFACENDSFADDICAEQEKIIWCDVMIWQFPLWWFSVPAMLKGWVDKVFAKGKFYDNGKIFGNGFLKGKKAILSLTAGGPEKNYVSDKYGTIEEILLPIQRGVLQFTGFSLLQPEIHYSIERISNKDRQQILENWAKRLGNIEQEISLEHV